MKVLCKALDERDCHAADECDHAYFDRKVEHRSDCLLREKREFLRDTESKERYGEQCHGIELDACHEHLKRGHKEAVDDGDQSAHGDEQDAEACKARFPPDRIDHVDGELHDLVAVVADDVARTRRIVSARLVAEHFKAVRECPHEADPVDHEEHIESGLECHLDHVLYFVARGELHRDLPCRLYDGKDDKELEAVRQDVRCAGRDDMLRVVVHELAEDVPLARCFRQFRLKVGDGIRRRGVFVGKVPEPHVKHECAEVHGKSRAKHDLPYKFFAVLESERDHHARDHGHHDQDNVHRRDDAARNLTELCVKCAAESRPCTNDLGVSKRKRRIRQRKNEDGKQHGRKVSRHSDSLLKVNIR